MNPCLLLGQSQLFSTITLPTDTSSISGTLRRVCSLHNVLRQICIDRANSAIDMKQAQLKVEQAMLQQLHDDTITAHAALQAATTLIEQRRAISPCSLNYRAYGMCAYTLRVIYI